MTAPPVTAHPVALTLHTISQELTDTYMERRASIEADMLAILAKEHRFTIGLPGTGKSKQKRDLLGRINDAVYFEQLLSKTRPDAAILGPWDLPLLRDKGDFHRRSNGFLQRANYAFLDEIGKMGPTLGHDLLSILNERLYHEVNGGRSVVRTPLYSVFSASNEMIVEESDDAAALWDRLLVRDIVDSIQETSNFVRLLQMAVDNNPGLAQPITRTTIDFADLSDVIDNVVPAITVGAGVEDALLKLREELRQAAINPSDRRWFQCVRLLQASAFLAGRTACEEDDLHVLRFALWDVPTQINQVERTCLSISNPVAAVALDIMDKATEISAKIRSMAGQSLDARSKYGVEAGGKVKMLVRELESAKQQSLAAGRSVTKLDEVSDQLAALRTTILTKSLDLG